MPDTTFRIEFFASAAYNADGSGEAEDYLGSLEVTTDATGRSFSPSPSRRRPGCRSSRPRPPIPRATPPRSRPCAGPLWRHRRRSVRTGRRPAAGLLGRVGRWHRDPGPRCRAARPGVGPDALGLGRDADAVEYRRPDRLGRWDRIAVVQRSALGAERGARRA